MLNLATDRIRALSVEDEQALNSAAAARLQREAMDEPHRWAKGLLVGLIRGEVAAASFSFDEVLGVLRRVEPDPRRGMIVRMGDDPQEVLYDL